jgi:hypothetical protein
MKKIITTFALFTMMLSFTSFQSNPVGKGTNSPVGMIVKEKVAVQSLEMNPVGKGTNSPVGM